jgi:Skp family chaperone for outer membrane proteins
VLIEEVEMKKGLAVTAGAVFLAIFTSVAFAADKLAYVDLSRLFDEYQKTKVYDKILEEKQVTYEKERVKKVDEVKNLQDKMSLLNDKEKEAKKGDLEEKIKGLQDFDRLQTTDLRKGRRY